MDHFRWLFTKKWRKTHLVTTRKQNQYLEQTDYAIDKENLKMTSFQNKYSYAHGHYTAGRQESYLQTVQNIYFQLWLSN